MSELLNKYFLAELASMIHRATTIIPDAGEGRFRMTLDSHCSLELTTRETTTSQTDTATIAGIKGTYSEFGVLYLFTINGGIIMITMTNSVQLLTLPDVIYLKMSQYKIMYIINNRGDLYTTDPEMNNFTKSNNDNIVMISHIDGRLYILNSECQLVSYSNEVVTTDVVKIDRNVTLYVNGDVRSHERSDVFIRDQNIRLLDTDCKDISVRIFMTLRTITLNRSGVAKMFYGYEVAGSVSNISRISSMIKDNLIDKQGRVLNFYHGNNTFVTIPRLEVFLSDESNELDSLA